MTTVALPTPTRPARRVRKRLVADFDVARAAYLAVLHACWALLSHVERDATGDGRRVEATALETLRAALRDVPPGALPATDLLPPNAVHIVHIARRLVAQVPPLTSPTPGRLRGVPTPVFTLLVKEVTAASDEA